MSGERLSEAQGRCNTHPLPESRAPGIAAPLIGSRSNGLTPLGAADEGCLVPRRARQNPG